MAFPPLTREEAEKFTAENKHRHGRSWNGPVTISPTLGNGKPRCCGEVTDRSNSMITYWHQCNKAAKVTLADGSTWCGIHSPEAVANRKAKSDARYAAYQAEWDARERASREEVRRKAAFPKFLDALRQIEQGHNDPRSLASEVLADWPTD